MQPLICFVISQEDSIRQDFLPNVSFLGLLYILF